LAKQEGVTTVLLTAISLAEVKALLPLDLVDILVVKSAYEVYGEPQWAEKTLVLTPGSRGMRLGRLILEVDQQGAVRSFQHQITAMPATIANAARLAGWYEEYNQQIKADYLASVELKKKRETGEKIFAGAKTCQGCHEAQYKVWQAMRHAKAFRSLERVNKAFDPACIKCHAVGFEKEGGYIDSELTPHLANVQCESCHGAAGEHVRTQGVKPVANKRWEKAEICAQCHVQKHSPGFELEKYWPKIAH
ncbi:MAG: putative lipoprotein, partial [Halothiobacillaceae bacterium]